MAMVPKPQEKKQRKNHGAHPLNRSRIAGQARCQVFNIPSELLVMQAYIAHW